MGPLKVTATQGGATSGGMSLEVRVLAGAKAPASQTGAAVGAQSTTPNLSITPSTTGSLLYAAGLLTNAAAPTAESGTTLLASPGNAGLYYGAYKSSSTTTSGTPVLMGSSTGTGIAISVAEILPSVSSVSEWQSQPANASGTGTALTTGTITPPPNGLLIAMVSTNGNAGTTTMTITDTWGLTWTRLQQENGGGHGYTGVWVAEVPDPTPALLYVKDAGIHTTVTSAQTVNYTVQSTKSLILCCASLYSSDDSVTSYSSISDSAGNTWHYATAANQLPPYTSVTNSGHFYNTLIAWTWQDKGPASSYNLNFTGTAFVNMDISEWSGVGSVYSGAAASGTTGTTSLVGPTAPLVSGCVGIGITNTLSGSFTGTVTGSDGSNATSMPNEPVSHFVVYSQNAVAAQYSPYGFTWGSFGSGDDYASSLVILSPPGAPSGSFFQLVT